MMVSIRSSSRIAGSANATASSIIRTAKLWPSSARPTLSNRYFTVSSALITTLPFSRFSSSTSTDASSSSFPSIVSSSASSSPSSHLSLLSPADQEFLRTLTAPVPSIRLDNLLNQHGICGRKDTRQYCRQNKVTGIPYTKRDNRTKSVSDQSTLLQSGSIHVIPSSVRINGEGIPYAGVPLHLALYKPPNYVVSHSIEEQHTPDASMVVPEDDGNDNGNTSTESFSFPSTGNIYELLPPEFLLRNPLLSAIGRLDKFATGLLLFTMNGKLNERLTHPLYHLPKTYIVEVDTPFGSRTHSVDEMKQIFAEGKILLPDYRYTAPALFQPHRQNPYVGKVVLYEGRYHQLRRMFASLGYHVKHIHRTGIGKLSLRSLNLTKEGEWKLLTEEELASLIYSSSSYGTETLQK